MLPKNAALNQSPCGELPRRPLSLPGLKAEAFRANLGKKPALVGPVAK